MRQRALWTTMVVMGSGMGEKSESTLRETRAGEGVPGPGTNVVGEV